jgi:hypothetical protein
MSESQALPNITRGGQLRVFVSYCTLLDADLLAGLRERLAPHSPPPEILQSRPPSRFHEGWCAATRRAIEVADVLLMIVGTVVDPQMRDEARIARGAGCPVLALSEEAGDPRLRWVGADAVSTLDHGGLMEEIRRLAGE